MVKWFKRILIVMYFFFMALLGVWIMYENQVTVDVVFFGLAFNDRSLGLIICLMLAVGGVFGFFTSILASRGALFFHKRKIAKANREVARLKNAQLRVEG